METCCRSGNGSFMLCEYCLEVLCVFRCNLLLYPIRNRGLSEFEKGFLEFFIASVI